MYKYILLSSLICSVATAATTARETLRPWVQQATSIKVRTLIKNSFDIPITNDTTVGTVKSWFHENEGIPVDQQNLYVIKSWYVFWKENILLSNDTVNIKSAMNLYNANDFIVCLTLRGAR